MGLTRFLFPSLSVRALGMVERLTIASVCLVQIAFLVIRRPLLFDQSLLAASFRLFRLFLVSPIAIAILAGLLIGFLATGVVLPGNKSAERWNVRQALRATGVAVAGGLISVALFVFGLLLPAPWGYGFVVAGFLLGPWLPAQFDRRARRLVPSQEASSRWPNRREALRALLPVLAFLVVGAADITSLLSAADNRLFQKEAEPRTEKLEFPGSLPDDGSMKVVRLSSGLIRYRDVNPRGTHVVLGFHGFMESLYEFPLTLDTQLEKLDVRGIFIDRPGIGPVSTPWRGHDLADWARLVEEFDKTVLDSRPVSIVGHSAGGIYALACARLSCVRTLGLVSSPPPATYRSVVAGFFNHDNLETLIGFELFPHKLVPGMQGFCQQLLYDWKSFSAGMAKELGPLDAVFITQNENAFRQNMATSVLQGAPATIDDFRRAASLWPLTLADTTRVPVLIFRGGGDQVVSSSGTQVLQEQFVPHATRIDFPDMGHQPAPSHYAQIFEAVVKLHVQEEKKRLASTAR